MIIKYVTLVAEWWNEAVRSVRNTGVPNLVMKCKRVALPSQLSRSTRIQTTQYPCFSLQTIRYRSISILLDCLQHYASLFAHVYATLFQTDETREVCHMLYTAWPDYGVPQSAKALLQFLSLVRQQQSKLLASRGDTWAGHPRGPPIVVHCSAGIGRTGEQTFVYNNFN